MILILWGGFDAGSLQLLPCYGACIRMGRVLLTCDKWYVVLFQKQSCSFFCFRFSFLFLFFLMEVLIFFCMPIWLVFSRSQSSPWASRLGWCICRYSWFCQHVERSMQYRVCRISPLMCTSFWLHMFCLLLSELWRITFSCPKLAWWRRSIGKLEIVTSNIHSRLLLFQINCWESCLFTTKPKSSF